MTEVVRTRELRGIPRWLLRGYVEALGGTAAADGALLSPEEDVLVGEGWTARLIQLEDFQIGSLRSGRVRLEVRGESSVVDAVMAALEPRLYRGGG